MTKLLLLIIFAVSLMGNAYFMSEKVEQKQVEESLRIEQENSKIYFTEKLFSDGFALKDYSSTKFSLEEEGKDIIKNAREFHSSPALIKGEAYNEFVCAGYVFELTRKLWGATSPFLVGMMEQNSKTPADAWQLPYSYEYVGGKIMTDFSGDFSLDTKDYWEKIDLQKLQNFFNDAFSEDALFGDIGFLYRLTGFLHELKTYKNYNSHIAKNIGISTLTKSISDSQDKTHSQVFSDAFSCDTDIFEKAKFLLSHYNISLDGERIVFYENEFYYINPDNALGKKVIFQDLSNLQIDDITLMHFFEGANVHGLFEMTCGGDFSPINIMSINPRSIEKM